MARTVSIDKRRKQIVKKKGPMGTVHEGSRDSRRLRKALARDGRLDKLLSSRKRQEQLMVDRAAFFQETIRETGIEVFEVTQLQAAVKSFVDQYNEELTELQQVRRSGRPASSREDQLKVKISSLEKEYLNGFLLPDVTTKDDVAALLQWEGTWLQLTSLKWVRITEAGVVKPAAFPPNKD